MASAVKASQGLSPLSSCSALRADATEAPVDDAISQQLATAEALEATGQLDRAETVAQSALHEARERHVGPMEAEALDVLGDIAFEHRDGPHAESLFSEALETAERTGSDSLVARSALPLARAVGDLQDRTAEAKKWLGFADIYQRSGGDDFLLANLAFSRASLANHVGDFANAVEPARACIRILEERLPNDKVRLGSAHNELGRALAPLGRGKEAAAEFQRAFDLLSGSLGLHHPRLGLVLLSLASSARDNGRPEEALRLYEQARALLEETDPTSTLVPAVLSGIGRELYSLKRFDEARV